MRTKQGWKAGRLRMEGLEPERVEWDAVPTRSVLSHLQSPDRLIRKEAVFEALRRRQDMSWERNRLLREPHPLGQLGALLLLSRAEGSEAHGTPLEIAASRVRRFTGFSKKSTAPPRSESCTSYHRT